jgi:hypothetical protein
MNTLLYLGGFLPDLLDADPISKSEKARVWLVAYILQGLHFGLIYLMFRLGKRNGRRKAIEKLKAEQGVLLSFILFVAADLLVPFMMLIQVCYAIVPLVVLYRVGFKNGWKKEMEKAKPKDIP